MAIFEKWIKKKYTSRLQRRSSDSFGKFDVNFSRLSMLIRELASKISRSFLPDPDIMLFRYCTTATLHFLPPRLSSSSVW